MFPLFRSLEKARAKTNLSLRIGGRLPDGYHELTSLMATLALSDSLHLSLEGRPGRDGTWKVSSNAASLPEGPDNLAYRAAQVFFQASGLQPDAFSFECRIEKAIPWEAGLGGGSADAAAVLRFLWQAWQGGLAEAGGLNPDRLSPDDLEAMALTCGADVPFCLYGGLRYCRGVGQILSHPLAGSSWPVLLALPPLKIRTAEAFIALDRFREQDLTGNPEAGQDPGSLRGWQEALSRPEPAAAASLAVNDFLPLLAQRHGLLSDLICHMKEKGAGTASMSGSGPACFGLFAQEETRDQAARDLALAFPRIRLIRTRLSPEPEDFPF